MNPLQLLAMVTGSQKQAPQLGGMAGTAQQVMASRPYQIHVQEARALGQEPMTPEQFMQMQQQNALAKAAGQ